MWRALLVSAPPGVAAFLELFASLGRVPETFRELVRDPVGFVATTAVETIIGLFLAIVRGAIDLIVRTGLGSDRALGQEPGSTLGLLDLPIVAVTTGTSAARTGFGGLLGVVARFNGAVERSVAELGLAALPVATGLVVVETLVALYLAWVGIQAVATLGDLSGLPLISGLDSVLELLGAVVAPLRELVGGLFGR